MDIRDFSKMNRRRCESEGGFAHPIDSWSLSDWMVATAGEVGEAANVVKKLNRYRDGITGNTVSEAILRDQLADEIGDSFAYLDLLAQAAGIDLQTAVLAKFQEVSARIGYSEVSSDGATDDALIKAMVSRFLQWKLPADFSPDGGITFKTEFNEHTAHPMRHEPTGTNLFDAVQAEAMIRYLLEARTATASGS